MVGAIEGALLAVILGIGVVVGEEDGGDDSTAVGDADPLTVGPVVIGSADGGIVGVLVIKEGAAVGSGRVGTGVRLSQ